MRGVRAHPAKKMEWPGYDTKLHLVVSSGDLWSVEYPFIGITHRSTITWSNGNEGVLLGAHLWVK